MTPLLRSCGFHLDDQENSPFIQVTVMRASPNGPQELAGVYGDKSFESISDLVKVSGLNQEQVKKVIDKVTGLVNC